MAQRTIPIAAGRLDGNLDANGKRITGLATPTGDTDAATKAYVDAHGATAHASTHATGGSDPVTPASIGAQATIDDLGTIRSGAELGATAVQPAALAVKRDKTDFSIPVGNWVVEVPEGSTKTDQSKWSFVCWSEDEPVGWEALYDGVESGWAYNEGESALSIEWTDADDGLTYTATRTAADTIAKTSAVTSAISAAVNGDLTPASVDLAAWDLLTVSDGASSILEEIDVKISNSSLIAAKRNYTDYTASGSYWTYTIPSGSAYTDESKYSLQFTQEETPGEGVWTLSYNGTQVGDQVSGSSTATSLTFTEGGRSYVCTKVSDTIAKTSAIRAHNLAADAHSALLATKAAQTPTFSEAATLANLTGSGEAQETLWGKVKKAIGSFISHLTDTSAHSSLFAAKLNNADGYVEADRYSHEQGSDIIHEGRMKITRTQDVYESQLTITHTGSGDETLTQRIVRDAQTDSKLNSDQIADAWSSATTYAADANVTYKGKFYKSLQSSNLNHSPDESSSAWWEVCDVFSESNTSLMSTINGVVGTPNATLEAALGSDS